MKVARVWLGALALASLVGLVAVGVAGAAATAVPLGGAQSFSVLAGAGIANTGPTRISGDLGTFPTTSFSGAASLTVGGTNHGGDAVTQRAKTDLVTAYTTAAGEGPTSPIAGDLVGRTLVAGVYNSASSIGLSGAVTLNGEGNPNAVFVFQAGSSLTTASGSRIVLINGAQACNVFWKVGSSATLGTGSSFVGSVIALTSITVTTGVTVDGRVLARNGAVTLDTDTITTSSCASPPVATAPVKTTPTPTAPGATAPVSTTPGSTAPSKTAPSKTTPGSTTPGKTTPGTTTPGKTTPGTTTPGKTTPGKTTPDAPATPSISRTQDLVMLLGSHVAYARPDASSPSLAVVRPTTPITKGPCVLPVIGTYGAWLEVRLPGRPNGRTGWIERRATTRALTSWHLVVDSSRRVVTAYHWGRVARSFRAVVGSASTPTPSGEFYVEETVSVRSSEVGGPFALALSARSNALRTYAGGPGQVALHGLSNIGGTLGTAVSSGCVRLDDSAMRWLVARIGPGTPITILGRN